MKMFKKETWHCALHFRILTSKIQMLTTMTPEFYASEGPLKTNVKSKKWTLCKKNKKGKVCPITGHEGPAGEHRYSCTPSFTWVLYGVGWSTPRPGHFTAGKRPGTHCTGSWVSPRVGLDGYRRSRPNRVRTPDRPARSESSISYINFSQKSGISRNLWK